VIFVNLRERGARDKKRGKKKERKWGVDLVKQILELTWYEVTKIFEGIQ